MRRIAIAPRPDFLVRAKKLGFDFAEIDGEPYWDETAYWRFSAAEIDALDDATAELQRLCLQAADFAVWHDRREMLGIPPNAWPVVVDSFSRREPSLYGRMDLRWDGSGPPKLLEYNADTPTALYEASVVQWEWLQTVFPQADQFNSIHERLIATWREAGWPRTVHFTCMQQSAEDRTTVEYLRDTAMQAGKQALFLALENIGWDGERFVDLDNHRIEACFKLYPWEFLLSDAFGAHIARAPTRWIEPAWRVLLSGKGLLALLWELFPGHPNLLPAFLGYFVGSLVLLAIFLWLHKVLLLGAEWRLIREGNVAAALCVGGAAGGFALPPASAIVHSASFADMVVWAVISGVVQFGCFAAMRLLRRDAAAALAGGDMAEATVMAAFSLVVGALNAACLS